MVVDQALIKELRERTGAGVVDCKKALQAANGDINGAIEEIRKAGQAKAVKKATRVAAQGCVTVKVSTDGKSAVMTEINCETDFVARDEHFLHFAQAATSKALETKTDNLEELQKAVLENGTIEQVRQGLVAKIGENIEIRRAAFLKAQGQIASYVHNQRIGVVVDMVGGDDTLARDIAMHVAASHPQFLLPEEVPQDLVAKEKEIFMAQALESGKPAEIIEKMISGRIHKFMQEVSLMGQLFVKDPSITIGALLQKANAKVVAFIRFEVGEGIEKKTENFVEEVMAQVRGSE